MIWKTNRVALAHDFPIKRMPPRDPKIRQFDYLEKFDFTTIFSDVFIRDGRVWMLGPPYLNLERELHASKFIWNWEDISHEIKFEPLNRMSRASFPTSAVSGELKIISPIGEWKLYVSDFGKEPFKEDRLLVTQQKDNRLEWIAYWAFFNVQINGIDSIVIYDNQSTLYTIERIDQLLGMIPGLKRWAVVDWDTPFGLAGKGGVWDSDFGQHVAWEHSRRAFSTGAKSVMMIDIDELPVTNRSKGILEQLENSGSQALFFKRQPIRQYPNNGGTIDGVRVHSNFTLGESRGAWLSGKYAFVPERLPDSTQLMVHAIRGVRYEAENTSEVFAGHFDSIRIRWRLGEKKQVSNFATPEDIQEPVEVISLLQEKFSQLAPEWDKLVRTLQPLINSQDSPHLSLPMSN